MKEFKEHVFAVQHTDENQRYIEKIVSNFLNDDWHIINIQIVGDRKYVWMWKEERSILSRQINA